jgi:sugar lactone lactonase YvrE
MSLVLVVTAVFSLSPLPAQAQAAGDARAPLDVRLFTRIGPPGHPDPIAVDEHGSVYVGTSTSFRGFTENRNEDPSPSKIFVFARDGTLRQTLTVAGQRLEQAHGILGVAFDAQGRVYATDVNPPRVIMIDPRTRVQRTYATFHDVPVGPESGASPCQNRSPDRGPFPNGLAFATDGTLYVTDYYQGMIWRIPRGGGPAQSWLNDVRLGGFPFGPNGIKFLRDGSTLLLSQSNCAQLLTVPVRSNGSPGELKVFWAGGPFDGPDSFALAQSGNAYVALAGANQLLKLSADGQELARIPASPLENGMRDIAFDAPADVAFLEKRALLTNSSFFAASPESWAVFDIYAGELGLPLIRPRITPGHHEPQPRPPTRPKITLRVRPRTALRSRRTCFRFRATGRHRGGVRRATIRFARGRAGTNSRGRAVICTRLYRSGTHRAVAAKRGLRKGYARVRVQDDQ